MPNVKCKTALLVINPGTGRHIADLKGMMAVFAAAGWKTDTALKEFGGHARELAREAARTGYDVVIGFGGDGTLNQVVNGVMADKRRRSIVAVIPGGTANVWAHEIGLPEEPIKAALHLINSKARKIDLGRVAREDPSPEPGSKARGRAKERPHGDPQQFLLMAGLGLDAAVLAHVSTPLKEKFGEVAVALATVESLPAQSAFPIELRSACAGCTDGALWEGEALQVIVGNTRRYGNIAEATHTARIDDGVLDVCIITAGSPLTSFVHILATLMHRKPHPGHAEYFRGANFRISVPANICLQLDGSLVELEEPPSVKGRHSRGRADDTGVAMVTYRFDAMPKVLRAAIPKTYNGALFRAAADGPPGPHRESEPDGPRGSGAEPQHDAALITAALEHGWKVTVVGVGPDPERKGTTILAGTAAKKQTKESKPVAVRIDRDTALLGSGGKPLECDLVADLSEGDVIIVEGTRNRHNVIRARRIVVMH
jgi:YegS/Rv2252/BmrU family lipid kinase